MLQVPPNDKPATNVNELRAHDIKVIMAMGDSMTAAFAATSGHILDPPLVPREDRCERRARAMNDVDLSADTCPD